MFDQAKQQALSKLDRSKKGEVDEEILPLITTLNKKRNFYTTSSCAGRIVLLELKGEKKHEAHWQFCSHTSVKELDLHVGEFPVWFRFDPPIIHLCSRGLTDAQAFLGMAKIAGFKHTGIISTGKKIMIELMGHDKIVTLVAENGHRLVDTRYIEILVKKANEAMQRSHARLEYLHTLMGDLT
ncbi:MAG: tRNA-wybutosine modification methyltransferase TYW3 [Nanobdellota archaeon]